MLLTRFKIADHRSRSLSQGGVGPPIAPTRGRRTLNSERNWGIDCAYSEGVRIGLDVPAYQFQFVGGPRPRSLSRRSAIFRLSKLRHLNFPDCWPLAGHRSGPSVKSTATRSAASRGAWFVTKNRRQTSSGIDPASMPYSSSSLAAAAAFHCSKFILWLADDGFDFLTHTDGNSSDRVVLSVDLSQ